MTRGWVYGNEAADGRVSVRGGGPKFNGDVYDSWVNPIVSGMEEASSHRMRPARPTSLRQHLQHGKWPGSLRTRVSIPRKTQRFGGPGRSMDCAVGVASTAPIGSTTVPPVRIQFARQRVFSFRDFLISRMKNAHLARIRHPQVHLPYRIRLWMNPIILPIVRTSMAKPSAQPQTQGRPGCRSRQGR
jgi:hypothetical protein